MAHVSQTCFQTPGASAVRWYDPTPLERPTITDPAKVGSVCENREMPSHNLLPPARIVALGGPVSAALAAMRSDPYAADMERLRSLRRAIADRIAADLDLLDALDGDTDFEAVNEDGGDICDEPHDEDTDREPSMCGITVAAHFATGPGCFYGEAEPSLASLGGTAAGIDQPQTGWAGGDNNDKEEDTGSRTHHAELMHREPGLALTEARERADRLSRRRRRGGELRILGPDSNFYALAAIGRR